jgi:hypothetical protein
MARVKPWEILFTSAIKKMVEEEDEEWIKWFFDTHLERRVLEEMDFILRALLAESPPNFKDISKLLIVMHEEFVPQLEIIIKNETLPTTSEGSLDLEYLDSFYSEDLDMALLAATPAYKEKIVAGLVQLYGDIDEVKRSYHNI